MEKDKNTGEIHKCKSNSYYLSVMVQSLVWAVKNILFWRAHFVEHLNLPQSSKMVMYYI